MNSMLRTGLLAAVVVVASCGDGSPSAADGGGLDREAFIATYVDLRAAAVRAEEGVVSDAERAAILGRRGVTEEQLMAFAGRHGQDVEFMRGVWDEVEARMDAERILPGVDTP